MTVTTSANLLVYKTCIFEFLCACGIFSQIMFLRVVFSPVYNLVMTSFYLLYFYSLNKHVTVHVPCALEFLERKLKRLVTVSSQYETYAFLKQCLFQ